MSESIRFEVVYAGSALDSNEMDARELAPALVAIADLLEEANRLVNGEAAQVKVNVRGSFKSGSFGIDFTLFYDWLKNLLSSLNSDPISGALNLLEIVGLAGSGAAGVIQLIKRIKGRNITKAEELPDGRVIFTIEENERIETRGEVVKLYRSRKVREALDDAIYRQLERDGIDEFRASVSARLPEVINKESHALYIAPEFPEEPLGETVTDAHLQIVALSFNENNKWRFSRSYDEQPFFASIKDDEFLGRVDRREIQFAKGDILKVKLRTREGVTNRGLYREYFVDKVLDHRTMERQLPLPIEPPKE